MKLRVSAWRLIKVYLVMGLVFGVVFYSIPGFVFPPTRDHYIIMGIFLATTLVYVVISILTNYYIVENGGIFQKRFTKSLFFKFDEIIYVDHEYTIKRKTLRFVTDRGQLQFLLLDKDGAIYEAVKKNCTLIDEDELNRRFPRPKI